jgi:hypothetical protein
MFTRATACEDCISRFAGERSERRRKAEHQREAAIFAAPSELSTSHGATLAWISKRLNGIDSRR